MSEIAALDQSRKNKSMIISREVIYNVLFIAIIFLFLGMLSASFNLASSYALSQTQEGRSAAATSITAVNTTQS